MQNAHRDRAMPSKPHGSLWNAGPTTAHASQNGESDYVSKADFRALQMRVQALEARMGAVVDSPASSATIDGVDVADAIESLTINGQPKPASVSLPPHLRGKPVAQETSKKAAPLEEKETVMPSQEDAYTQFSHKLPMFVRNLAPLPESKISIIPPTTKTMTFTLDFIRGFLGGIEWSPGLFYVPPSHGRSVLPTRTFYLLDGTHQPYLPVGPGAHGALLTAFFNENPEEYDGDEAGAAYNDVPVFICNSQYTRQIGYPFQQELNGATPPGREGKHLQTRYTYYGTYSQTRWSDKLDYDRLQEDVPQSTKMHIAETLAEVGRPEWVTEALMKHLFPKPEYEGRLPKGGKIGAAAANLGTRTNITEDSEDEDAVAGQIQHDVASYLRKLESWEKDSRMKIKLLKKENILEAFEKPDVDDPPGLRLFWEYLECVGWDRGFYNTLVEQMLKSASR